MEIVSWGKYFRLFSRCPGRILIIFSFLLLLFITGCQEDPLSSQNESQPEGCLLIKNSAAPNLGNPVTIHEWQNFPEGADITHYYVFFELAVRYLFTDSGEQRSLDNVVRLFYDIREGMPFSSGFEDNFGIRLAEYQTSFYERIRQFLQS